MGRLQAFDGLRFIACLLVYYGHFGWSLADLLNSQLLKNLLMKGSIGLNFFFLLSGFILYIAYKSKPMESRRDKADFWVGRFARIYPAYLFICLASFPLLASLHVHCGWELGYIALNVMLDLTMTQSWAMAVVTTLPNYLWAISTFAFFWITFPWFVRWIKNLSTVAAIHLLSASYALALSPFLLYFFVAGGESTWYFVWGCDFILDRWYFILRSLPPLRIPSFVMGMALGHLYHVAPASRGWRVWLVAGDLCFLVTMAIGLLVPNAVAVKSLNSNRVGYSILFDVLLSPLQLVTMYSLACERGLLAWVLSTRPMATLGTWSFSIYMYSNLVAYLHTLINLNPYLTVPGAFLAELIALIALSGLLYTHLEEPIAKALISRWKRAVSGGSISPGPEQVPLAVLEKPATDEEAATPAQPAVSPGEEHS